MDNIINIALAKISSILANKNYIKHPRNSIWEEIFKCAGQSSYFEAYKQCLVPYSYYNGYENDNPSFDEFRGIHGILIAVYKDGDGLDELFLVLKEIVERINVLDIIQLSGVDSWDNEKKEKRLLKQDDKIKFINENMENSFREMVNCINVLSLDVNVLIDGLKLVPISGGLSGRAKSINQLESWIEKMSTSCANAYASAIQNYSEGRFGSCIAECRSLLVGIFDLSKTTEKWFSGIINVLPETLEKGEKLKIITEDKSDGNYPRSKAVYSIYRMLCDLGAHRTEAKLVDDERIIDEPTPNDALMCLRITEDILIYVMRESMYKMKMEN